jgi:hypothetical protein
LAAQRKVALPRDPFFISTNMIPRDRRIERPPSKISALIFIMLGIFALFVAGFVVAVPGTFFGVNEYARIGFSAVIGLYGAFRVFSGITAIRKASEAEGKVHLNGKTPLRYK